MVSTFSDKSFDWIQIKLLNPATLGWVAVAIGAALVIRSAAKIRKNPHHPR
jgi:hypothetical protein